MADLNNDANKPWAEAMRRSTESNLSAAIAACEGGEEQVRALLSGAMCALVMRLWKHKPDDYAPAAFGMAVGRMTAGYVAQILVGDVDVLLGEQQPEPTPAMIAAGAQSLRYVADKNNPALGYDGLAKRCWEAMQQARFAK